MLDKVEYKSGLESIFIVTWYAQIHHTIIYTIRIFTIQVYLIRQLIRIIVSQRITQYIIMFTNNLIITLLEKDARRKKDKGVNPQTHNKGAFLTYQASQKLPF